MSNHWLAVASAEHVRKGRAEGFMQVCHGRAAPLRRIQPGDGMVYYSPGTRFGERDGLSAMTAIGIVRDGDPYQIEMGDGFRPFRRDVAWATSREIPIRPLLDQLDFTAGRSNWGYQLRAGIVPISAHDFVLIGETMEAELPAVTR